MTNKNTLREEVEETMAALSPISVVLDAAERSGKLRWHS
jgi:hypothetical protein